MVKIMWRILEKNYVGSETTWKEDPDLKKIIPDPQHWFVEDLKADVLLKYGTWSGSCGGEPDSDLRVAAAQLPYATKRTLLVSIYIDIFCITGKNTFHCLYLNWGSGTVRYVLV